MESVVDEIRRGKYRNIIILTGAGISKNAGIPDYRSKNGFFTELLNKFPQIKSPEDLFSRSLFEKYHIDRDPIYQTHITKIKNSLPTETHRFCKWLDEKGWLKRVYTQNIDGLHQKAGLSEEMVIEFHGSLLKNNIVYYEDPISQSVIDKVLRDFTSEIDLIIVMGSSLQVAPFCALPNLVNRKTCFRILVDLHPENAITNSWSKPKYSHIEGFYSGMNFSSSLTFRSRNPSKIKRTVTLRPQWTNYSKWRNQLLIKSDTDTWVSSIMNS